MNFKITELVKNLVPTIVVIIICSFFYISSTVLYKKDVEELETMSPEQIGSKANSIASDLRDKKVISGEEYVNILQKIAMIEKAYGKTKAAQTAIKTLLIGGGSIAAVAGEQALQHTIFGNK